MIEILAQNSENLFTDKTGLSATRTYEGKVYDVYEVPEETFIKMNTMSEEEYEKICPHGLWRHSVGSNLGVPNATYIINGKEIIAWDGSRRSSYFDDFCKECSDYQDSHCAASSDDILKCLGERKYDSLLKYMCEEIGASQPRNVCALGVSLAKYNNMTMGELFKLCEGELDKNNEDAEEE